MSNMENYNIKEELLKFDCAKYLDPEWVKDAIPCQIAVWKRIGDKITGKIVAICWRGKDSEGKDVP